MTILFFDVGMHVYFLNLLQKSEFLVAKCVCKHMCYHAKSKTNSFKIVFDHFNDIWIGLYWYSLGWHSM